MINFDQHPDRVSIHTGIHHPLRQWFSVSDLQSFLTSVVYGIYVSVTDGVTCIIATSNQTPYRFMATHYQTSVTFGHCTSRSKVCFYETGIIRLSRFYFAYTNHRNMQRAVCRRVRPFKGCTLYIFSIPIRISLNSSTEIESEIGGMDATATPKHSV